MKKILLPVAVLFCTSTILAQPDKGTWLLGGRSGFSSSSQDYFGDKIKQTDFRLGPRLGYFVRDQLAVTLNPGFEAQTYQFGNSPKQKYNEFDVGAGLQYYFLPPERKFNVYAEAGYMLGSYKEDDDERVGYGKYHLGAGGMCFINQHVAFDFGIGYGSKKYENEDERINRISITTGFQIFIDCLHKKNGDRPEMVSKL